MRNSARTHQCRINLAWLAALVFIFGTSSTMAAITYEVGFKVHDGYDHGRSYRFERNLAGNMLEGSASRPMQVGIWYPAKSKTETKMSLRAYTRIGARADDPATANKDRLANAAIRALEISPSFDLTRLNQGLDEKTLAYLDATAKSGTFPVVLMSMGSGALWYNNYGLAEALAARGYIVLASRSAANNHIYMSTDQEGVEAGVADLSYLARLSHELPNADPSRVAVIGRSWGAVPAVVYAGRNEGVDARVSLDGTISYNANQLREGNAMSLFIGGETVKDPLFVAVGAKRPANATAIDRATYFENVTNADAYHAEYHEMQHASFSSRFLTLYFRDAFSEDENPHIDGFNTMTQDVGNFLDHYVANQNTGTIEFPKNDIRTIDAQAASTISPDPNAFSRTAFDMGADAAVTLYKEVTRRDPEQKLFGWRTLVNLCELLIQQGRYEDAAAIARFSIEQYPDRAIFIALEGEAYLAERKIEAARTAFERALGHDPDQSIAKALLERLND